MSVKNAKPVLLFDLKEGKWFVDVSVLRLAIKKGLGVVGIQTALGILESGFSIAKQEIRYEKRGANGSGKNKQRTKKNS